jgi:hypothetical protein
MHRLIFLLALLFALTPLNLAAQYVGTFQVIAQVADGTLPDGTYYITQILLSRWDIGPVYCTVTPVGLTANRFISTTVTMPDGVGSTSTYTLRNGPLATGYVTVSCDKNVVVNALYRYEPRQGFPISMATVFSSPPAMKASIWAPNSLPPAARIAIAVANDSTQTATYTITAASVDGTSVSKQFTLPPKSASPKFLDELFPGLRPGPTLVYVDVNSAVPLYLTALYFAGQVFTTIPPTVYF